MTGPGPYDPFHNSVPSASPYCDSVGAYLLGVLDDADATRFEFHLADCDACGAELDSLSGLGPLLAEYAAGVADPMASPSPDLLERLMREVSEERARKRRKRFVLVAAAAALIIGGPVIAASVSSSGSPSGSGSTVSAATPSAAAVARAADVASGAVAVVSMVDKGWGTDVSLTLRGAKGPQKCYLVAVSKDGEQETVSTWSVPAAGYGVPGHPDPLVVEGGTGFARKDIAHFEVRTSTGTTLVTVNT
jgi:hypothetical protein